MSSKLTAAGTVPQTGLLDLERELVCSICTETLYQPLTLLDCLHTFCGSCLKEWFTFEYKKARSSSSSSARSNPYTCPTCRAPVKDARHNATVTTLLEMFLGANPDRGKSEEDKADIDKSYTPGENILPKLESSSGRRSRRREEEDRAEEEAERRQLEEARERSIRETRGTAAQVGTHLAPPVSEGSSSRSRSQESRGQRRRDDERREERRERRRRAEAAEAQLRQREAAASTSSTTAVAHLTTQNLMDARLSPPATSPRHPSAVEARQQERRIVPQTSLRSLMSSSESGAGTGDSLEAEQILQQIISEGMLEGIDLHDLDPAQEDALSERIAEAYRQRHQSRSQQSSRPTLNEAAGVDNGNPDSSRTRERQHETQRRHHQRSQSAHGSVSTETRQAGTSEDRRPPVSRIRFQDPADASSTAQSRRDSENERRRTSPTARSHRTNSEDVVSNQATRSAVDLSHRPRTSDDPPSTRSRHPSDTRRTNTEPEQVSSISDRWRRAGQASNLTSSSGHLPHSDVPIQLSSESTAALASASGPPNSRSRNAVVVADSPTTSPRISSQSMITPAAKTITTASRPAPDLPPRSIPQFSEPVISCVSCSRPNIQYDLHKHCSRCSSDICLQCYRTVPTSIVGCTLDSIPGSTSAAPTPTSPPRSQAHTLTSRKYLRPNDNEHTPKTYSPRSGTNGPLNKVPPPRLEEGRFCDLCHSFANTCYWSCDTCNKGDWGFCNFCINRHRSCTHHLLPLAHKSYAPKSPTLQQGAKPDSGVITLTPSNLHAEILASHEASKSRPSTSSSSTAAATLVDPDYVVLTFNTHCDICTYPIPPSHTRFHCPSHPCSLDRDASNMTTTTGDYDICTNCYLNLIKLRKIRKDDGPNGWRKCPQGHRMIVIGFEDTPEGQKRIVVNDLVGGHSLRDVDLTTPSTAENTGAGNASRTGQWTWVEDTLAGTVTRESRASRLRSTYAPSSSALSSGGNNTTSTITSSKFPPDGGTGMRAIAVYPWFPEEGEPGAGELMFPRWAEIREIEDVNGEWWAGVYAGGWGVFPGGCVRVI